MMLARLGSLRAMRPVGRFVLRDPLVHQIPNAIRTPQTLFVLSRNYNEFNRVEDMLGAADAWHLASALPDKFDLSDISLRNAFDRIDLNGNGVIEANELKASLMVSSTEPVDDVLVDDMIKWACNKTPNGDIDFEEYCAIMRVKLPNLKLTMSSYFKEQQLGRDTV